MDAVLTAPVPPRPPLLTRRLVFGLGFVAVAEALLVCLAALPGMGLGDVLDARTLPKALVGLALGLGLALTPAWAGASATTDTGTWPARSQRERRTDALARSAFVGAWQAAALGYFLLVASRLTPLESEGVVRSLVVVAATLAFATLLAGRWPHAYAGIAVVWAVVIPVGCYVVAEVFLAMPEGVVGWRKAHGPGAEGLRQLVDWLLCLSPGTAGVGALNGKLVSDGACGWKEAVLLAGGCLGGGLVLLVAPARRRPEPAASRHPTV